MTLDPTGIKFLASNQSQLTSFTRRTLHTALVELTAPFGLSDTDLLQLFDFDAGLNSLPNYPSAQAFWAHVTSQLRKLPAEAATEPRYRPITKVLLAGESVKEDGFLAALKDAMAEVSSSALLEATSNGTGQANDALGSAADKMVDPTFAAARGAALYARWRQEAPWGCVEYQECDERRKKERESDHIIRDDLVKPELK
jgi:hypothetical protein